MTTTLLQPLLDIDTEVVIVRLGPTISPYNDKSGRVVGHRDGLMHVILDDDPIPRWRNIGIWVKPEEVRCVDGLD
jgi:hypothetical protein